VLECHPDGAQALPDCVWLDTPGKVLHVEAARLEFPGGMGGLIAWCTFHCTAPDTLSVEE
jgi:hypothetical protein